MGLIGPVTYTNEKGETYWLHKAEKGERTLYYFSQDPADAVQNVPKGFKIVENKSSNMPYLKKGQGGLVGKIMDLLGMDTDYHPPEGEAADDTE